MRDMDCESNREDVRYVWWANRRPLSAYRGVGSDMIVDDSRGDLGW